MDGINNSVVTEFVMRELSSSWEMKIFLFLFFFSFYMGIVLGNFLIVITVTFDSHLHSPMYFLLANLSLTDFGLASTTVPKMILDIFSEHKVISFSGCMMQMSFIHLMGGSEVVWLIAMAYDRYVAICKPLHYLMIMNRKACICFSNVAWIIGVLHAMSQLVLVIHLPFCGPNKLETFYCDFPQVAKLACTDTSRVVYMVSVNTAVVTMTPFVLLLISYTIILVTVRHHSSAGLSKAFSTLSAHLSVVFLFFAPCFFVYVWQVPTLSLDKFLLIFIFLITPFLNPIIYTFRNKDMKMAVKRLTKRIVASVEFS